MLTDAQKAKVRLYLGFPDLYRYQNVRLESALDAISSEVETNVISILARIAAVETRLDGTLTTAGLSSVGAGDPEFYEGAKLKEIRSEGRRLCGQLSMLFGVPLQGDAFSTNGYQGDGWMSGPFQYGGFFN